MKKWRQPAKWKLHFWKLFLFLLKIETKTNWTRNATHQTTTSLHQEWGESCFIFFGKIGYILKAKSRLQQGNFFSSSQIVMIHDC